MCRMKEDCPGSNNIDVVFMHFYNGTAGDLYCPTCWRMNQEIVKEMIQNGDPVEPLRGVCMPVYKGPLGWQGNGHMCCTSRDDCIGWPGDQLIRHVVSGEPGDLYCRTCFDSFVQSGKYGNLEAVVYDLSYVNRELRRHDQRERNLNSSA